MTDKNPVLLSHVFICINNIVLTNYYLFLRPTDKTTSLKMKGVILLCFALIAVAAANNIFTDHLFDSLTQELIKIETRIHGSTAVVSQATCLKDCEDNLPVRHLCKHLCLEAGKMYDNIASV